MKILGFTIRNARKIGIVQLSDLVQSGFIKFKGDNEAGKSTILECLRLLFEGGKIPKDFISHGKEKCEIIGEIKGYKIIKTVGKSNKLEVIPTNGKRPVNEPQTFLKKMITDLTFNPFVFLMKTDEQKFAYLLELFGVDFTKENDELKALEWERLGIGRDIKKIGNPQLAKKVEPVDTSQLFKEKEKIDKENTTITQEIKNLAIAVTGLGGLKQKRKNLLQQLTTLEKRISAGENHIANLKSQSRQPLDTSKVETKIINAVQTNEQAKQYERSVADVAEKEKADNQYATLTNQIEAVRATKRNKLKAVKIPVSGLKITETGIEHNGIGSDNWSDSEGIEISCKLSVGMNPELKAIFVDRGETFGTKRLKALEKWAIKNGIQVFITIVDNIPEINEMENDTIYIQEGCIVSSQNEMGL